MPSCKLPDSMDHLVNMAQTMAGECRLVRTIRTQRSNNIFQGQRLLQAAHIQSLPIPIA